MSKLFFLLEQISKICQTFITPYLNIQSAEVTSFKTVMTIIMNTMVSLLHKQAQIHSPRMQLATVIFVSSDFLQAVGYANQIFQV